MPETPKTSLATLDSLMFAVSSSLSKQVALGRAGIDQLAPVTQQIAQLSHRLGRHKAAADQTMTQQVGDPPAVLHIGLAPGHILDVMRIADHQLKGAIEHRIDGLPVDPSALHRHVRTAVLLQPLPHLPQRRRQRPEGADLLPRAPPRRAGQQARHHHRLMYIEAAAPLDNHVHLHLPCQGWSLRRKGNQTLPCVLTRDGGDKT
jgi:hypothetical protein